MPLSCLIQWERELGYLPTYSHQSLLQGCTSSVDSLAKEGPQTEKRRFWQGEVRPVGTETVRARVMGGAPAVSALTLNMDLHNNTIIRVSIPTHTHTHTHTQSSVSLKILLVYIPHLYPFMCQWILRLLPCLGYCK